MSIDMLEAFVGKKISPADAWNMVGVTDVATANFPVQVLGEDQTLLTSDQYRLWFRWFVEGIASPHAFAQDPATGSLDIFRVVHSRLATLYPLADKSRHKTVADQITEALYSEVEALRAGRVRNQATLITKATLIKSSDTPRCYICGFLFSEPAIASFVGETPRSSLTLPATVDILQPRGRNLRSIGIEVEHVIPVALGGSGQDNLRLACGWCNMYKSSRTSLYEASLQTSRMRTGFKLGRHILHELPAPFWTIRLMALRGRCEHTDGCPATATDAQLVIALRDWRGAPNPTNMAVYCQAHDPVAGARMGLRTAVDKLWIERRR